MVLLKACPRCHGDIHVNRDVYGEYRECFQCGWMQDIDTSSDALDLTQAKSKKKKAA